ncbi:hypothetical protein NQZ79_g1833 [Umbelopsis isabellina]|nr:hypothetical protein NQZ79_g1833 [Umbelopsis isabellina]
MATYQDIDWTWLKEVSQQIANSGASTLHKVFEPDYFSTLLSPNTVDLIRGIVGNEYLSTGAFLLICGSLLGPSSAALQGIQSRFWKAISVSVTIEERDEIYQAVEDFLTDLSKECKINNLIATKNMTSNPPAATNSMTTTSTSNVQYAPDVAQFFTSSSLYKHQSIPYRRTYLIEGPPGTGKSSLIQALAGHFQLNICMVNLSDSALTASTLICMMNTVPPNSLILIEDVDALAARTNFQHGGLSWSALLNCLDGIVSQEGTGMHKHIQAIVKANWCIDIVIVLFMTTNSAADLDAAFLRPGRIDKRITFNLADDFQIRQLFINFHGNIHSKVNKDETNDASYGTLASFLGMKRKLASTNSDNAIKMAKYTRQDVEFYSRCFANYIRPYTVSPAEIQSFFLSCRNDSIENVAHKGNAFLEMVKASRPTQQLYTPQKTHAERSLLNTSSPVSPLQLKVSERTLSAVSYATPTRPNQERKQVKKAVIVSPCEQNQAKEEPAVSYSKDSPDEDEVDEDEDEDEGDGEKEDDDQDFLLDLLVETHDVVEYDTEERAEEDQKVDNNPETIKVRDATSLGTKIDEKPLPQQHEFSDTDAETVAQSENDDTEELQNKTALNVHIPKNESLEEVHPDVGNDTDADDNVENFADIGEPELGDSEPGSPSEESEVDITPSGKDIKSMPYPSPRKQEKVVADVLKYKMGQGQNFLEATTAIFKEGIQGIEAAVINRVLGEKSVTPIKRVTHRVPSFRAKRANSKFNRKLRRERQQQVISEENERHGSKSNVKRENVCKGPGKIAVKDEAAGIRHKEQQSSSNHSPLRKFAKSQKQTSLRKAANMGHGNVKNSNKGNPNARSTKHDSDPDSSEYDSGTERARKDLEEFLQRKSGNKNKTK